MTGIYKITNLVTNKVYIGSAINIDSRIKAHISKLKGNLHINKHLQSSYNKYGENNFKFELIREVSNNILRRAEQFYINKYQSINPKYGYNKATVVSNTWDDIEKPIILKDKIYFGCYNKQGKLVKVFKTIDEVKTFLNVKKCTRVYESCNSNLTKTAYNYYWIRLDMAIFKFQNKLNVFKRKGRHRELLQYDLEGNFIKKWDCATDVAVFFNVHPSNITKCLKTNNIYRNNKWFYSAP
jgi:hypothetical protein